MTFLTDIDETLDQLIANAEAMKAALADPILETELFALQKVQESLLLRLVNREKIFQEAASKKQTRRLRLRRIKR